MTRVFVYGFWGAGAPDLKVGPTYWRATIRLTYLAHLTHPTGLTSLVLAERRVSEPLERPAVD